MLLVAGGAPLAVHSLAGTGRVAAGDPDVPTGADPDTEAGSLHARTKDAAERVGDPIGPHGVSLQAVAAGQMLAAQRAQRQAGASPTWTPLGPAPLPGGATSPPVPVSGRATAIAIDPTNSDDVYVGTAGGGIFRTVDGGETWSPLFDAQMPSLAIGALSFAPSDPTVLYVGTGEPNGSTDSMFGAGLFRINGATSDSPVLSGVIDPIIGTSHIFSSRSISSILVSSTDAASVLVGTATGLAGRGGASAVGAAPTGVYRSTNAEADPASVTFGRLRIDPSLATERVSAMAFPDPATPALLVSVPPRVGQAGGIYRTGDATASTPTFTRVYTDPLSSADNIQFATSPSVDYALEGGTSGGQLLVSTDQGATWTARPGFAGVCGSQCNYDDAVAVDPQDSQHVLAGGSSDNGRDPHAPVRSSTDGGQSSVLADSGLHADSHAIVFDPAVAGRVWTADDGGVFRSDNGGQSWQSENSGGLNTIQFESIATDPLNPQIAIGGTQDNGTVLRSATGGWSTTAGGDGGYAAFDSSATSLATEVIYHEFQNISGTSIGFERSTGTESPTGSWTHLGCSNGVSGNGISCSDTTGFYPPIALGPGAPNSVYFGTDRLYRSSNEGQTMTVVSQAPLAGTHTITAIGISPTDDGVRLVGTRDGHVWATTTGSATLTDVTGGWPSAFISRIAMDPADANVAYIALSGYFGSSTAHVWRTGNLLSGAPTWQPAAAGIPDVPVDVLAVDPTAPDRIFAGTDVGVLESTDGGGSWAPYGSGLPALPVFGMNIVSPGTDAATLRIATHGQGAWQAPLTGQNVPDSITVTPAAPSVAAGDSQAFMATASYSDGSSADVTGAATWSTSDATVAAFTTPGNASTAKAGTVGITASLGAVTGQASMTVTAPVVRSIDVQPTDPQVLPGGTQQLSATAVYSDDSRQDVTDSTNWTSGDPAVASVSATGLVTGVAPGTVAIQADAAGQTATSTVTVAPDTQAPSVGRLHAAIASKGHTADVLRVKWVFQDPAPSSGYRSSTISVTDLTARRVVLGARTQSSQSAKVSVRPGHKARIRVSVLDAAGNASATAALTFRVPR